MNTAILNHIVLNDVSKFYGDVLGVNCITFSLGPGITGLVGPNGAGKSTLMNLIAGLLHPSGGSISVLGKSPRQTELFFRNIGYCSQYDSFPASATGKSFIQNTLLIHGFSKSEAEKMTIEALGQVNLLDVANDRIASYSKGMRQRIKLAYSICHQPKILILDEPLNGLDPIARTQVINLFRDLAQSGVSIMISSHILHEIELISDHLIMIKSGYLMADGEASGIRNETGEPMRVYIRSRDAQMIAKKLFDLKGVLEAQLHNDKLGLFVRTENADEFYLAFNNLVFTESWEIEAISPSDETVEAIYQHLIVQESSVA